SVAKEFARLANVPGFRRGKAPVSLIRRKFAEDIKGEVLQSLVPERVEKAVAEQKLTPVSQPQVDKLDFNEGQPLKFRAVLEVLRIKTKKLPEINDEFAKDVSDATSLDELKKKVREGLEHQRDHKHKEMLHEKVLAEIVKQHDFPVPEALVEHQMDVRLERVVRSLAAQGVDPRAVNVDWVTLRKRQQERAKDDVKAELIIDRIATAENIDVTDEELTHELEHMAGHSNESAEALRARLTKQGTLDRMKAKLRSDKTLDWLAQNAKIKTVAAANAAT